MTDELIVLKARIAELEEKVRVLRDDLIHDSLTGLKTRGFFNEEAKVFYNAVTVRKEKKRLDWFGIKNISFVFFDIDYFKKINDAHGHDAGDKVLERVANTIESSVRKGDIAARWGGEEILVALVGASEKVAYKKAEEIRKLVSKLQFEEYPDLEVTLSGGVASAERDLTFEDVIKRADDALYRAKEAGRNQIVVYSEI